MDYGLWVAYLATDISIAGRLALFGILVAAATYCIARALPGLGR